jgi:3-oxoadipate enol-lactonase
MPSLRLEPTLTTYYEDHYFGPPWENPSGVVLLHGAGDSSASWFAWMPRLTPHFRVLRPDLRGFGRSTVPPPGSTFSVAEYARDLAKFLDALQIDSVHVVGAKIGGTIGLQFAVDFPARARTLTVVSSPVRSHNPDGSGDMRGNAARLAGLTVREWAEQGEQARLGSRASPAEVVYWTEAMSHSDHGVMVGIAAMLGTLDLYARLPAIMCPTLVLTSRATALQSLDVVNGWQPTIPRSELYVIDTDAFHPAAAEPKLCCDVVLPFLLRH